MGGVQGLMNPAGLSVRYKIRMNLLAEQNSARPWKPGARGGQNVHLAKSPSRTRVLLIIEQVLACPIYRHARSLA